MKRNIIGLLTNKNTFILLLIYTFFIISLPTFSVYPQKSGKNQNSKNPKPEKLKGSINTSLNEFGISLTNDGNSLYFYSKRQNSNYTDIYKSIRTKDEWAQGEEIEVLNSNFDDQSPFILNKEEGILFSSNRDGAIEFQFSNGKIGVSRDIYFSKRINSSWAKPIPLPRTVNTEEIEENPFLFNDRLYFTRYPFGQVSEADIFVSVYKNNTWEKAMSLPDPINTAYSEIAATISKDGKTIYFLPIVLEVLAVMIYINLLYLKTETIPNLSILDPKSIQPETKLFFWKQMTERHSIFAGEMREIMIFIPSFLIRFKN
ncbi:WD40-like protein [Leptospira interrogans serovar Bataviae str. HAI135]|nr:WD40-like protein [Leptospira interrogans serovar Bataviae str. HAI135]